MSGIGEPRQLTAACVTADWFQVYRAHALLGRTFLPDEDQPGRANAVVLDYGFWMRTFGGDRSIIGRALVLDRSTYVVAGVMPKDFLPLGKGAADLYMPWVIETNPLEGLAVTARLRDGVTIEQARAALIAEEARLAAANPADYAKGVTAQVELLKETIVGSSRELLRLLIAASALVLLIACVNTANLFLARAAAKTREMKIREFLGASTRQLLAPILAESAVVSLAGGTLGLLAAWALARLLAARLENFPRAEDIAVDPRVALVTLAISVAAVFAPLLFRKQTAKNTLVVAEIALTFVLLICSGLLMRSFVAMRQVDLGYNPSGVILGFVAQPPDARDRREEAVAIWRGVRERIASIPGVESVATTTATPAGGLNAGLPVILEGEPIDQPGRPNAEIVIASGGYFHVAGIPLREGRTFHDRDARVVIVSQSVADRYFAGKAVGRRIQLPAFDFNVTALGRPELREIVGVVGNVKAKSVGESDRMTLYLPESGDAVRYATIMARATIHDPMRLEKSIRRAMFEEAPGLTLAPMLTLDRGNAYLTRAPLRAMWLIGIFAGLALALATVGVHGVVAYAASRRNREMGIRMALGARSGQLFSLVTGQAIRLAVMGAAIGIAAAYGCTRLLASLLFGVGRADPATYAAATLVLSGAAWLASVAPALRAARTDPSVALRAD